jgi:proteic killer suppression protein
MIISFKHKGLERFYKNGSKLGIQSNHAARLQLILGRLNASSQPKDMNLPGLSLHQLLRSLVAEYLDMRLQRRKTAVTIC